MSIKINSQCFGVWWRTDFATNNVKNCCQSSDEDNFLTETRQQFQGKVNFLPKTEQLRTSNEL